MDRITDFLSKCFLPTFLEFSVRTRIFFLLLFILSVAPKHTTERGHKETMIDELSLSCLFKFKFNQNKGTRDQEEKKEEPSCEKKSKIEEPALSLTPITKKKSEREATGRWDSQVSFWCFKPYERWKARMNSNSSQYICKCCWENKPLKKQRNREREKKLKTESFCLIQ